METSAIFCHERSLVLARNFHTLHLVVILRIVHTCYRFDNDSRLGHYILRIEVELMSMKRTDAVRSIQEILLVLVSNNIYCPPQSIGTQMCRNHPFIDFYTFDNVCRKIGQCYTGTFGIKRHTVQKVANGITRQAINRKVVVRTHATFLTHFHTSSPINDGVQALRSVYQRLYVHGIDSICPFPQLLRLALAVYLYSIQANRTFLQDEIHLFVRTHVNGLFFILITYHRHD